MEAADFVTHYFDRDGQQVEPPALTGDEDTDIANHEDFVLRVEQTAYCTADGSAVYVPGGSNAQEMRCGKGHRWLHVAPDPNVSGSTWGWRQVN